MQKPEAQGLLNAFPPALPPKPLPFSGKPPAPLASLAGMVPSEAAGPVGSQAVVTMGRLELGRWEPRWGLPQFPLLGSHVAFPGVTLSSSRSP